MLTELLTLKGSPAWITMNNRHRMQVRHAFTHSMSDDNNSLGF